MKVKENFNMDKCLEVLQKHFSGCSIEKKSGIMGEFIDIKKSYYVGSRIIYRKKKGKLNIGSRSNFPRTFGILVSISFVNEVKQILGSEFGSEG